MSPVVLSARIAGIGFWSRGLPSWAIAQAYAQGGELPADAPNKPSPQLLAPNERRRAPETVAVALEVALAACIDAQRDPKTLPSVFTSTHGDLAITDYMCRQLADDPAGISPIRFHNSVHNAAAGYWTIGVEAHAPATALSAFHGSFAQGLLEALTQLATGTDEILLVGYDSQSAGPLGRVSHSQGLLGGALVLGTDGDGPLLRVTLGTGGQDRSPAGRLEHLAAGNAMAPMLPLFDALANGAAHCRLDAGNGAQLHVEIVR
ncbi:beta-ketoacyl synthase chain length factor [Pseudoxanthomonas sp.]|uniref:beta-ketoacyl synthase chain length factor n=1 Tax=Pseudoxanthomonas sp. TaxID=1871049 RepID=UPI0026249237|nr:beta-ketoacyl synthase chain length factor [Pseudoxanthomonas sp.]WDS35418.1 MAG: beta-ketoacyl synthase chain length factor [Pseudoxanthomonas sp.]